MNLKSLSLLSVIIGIVVLLVIGGGFFYVRRQVSFICDSIDKQISSLIDPGISANIAINQIIPIKLDMFLKDIIDLNEILPQTVKIDQYVPINKTFHIEKEFEVNTKVPVKGDQKVTVNINVPFYGIYPIEVPFSLDMDIPVSVKVPVSLDIPIDDNFKIDMEIPLKDMLNIDPNKKIHIDKDIPVDLNLPVNFSAKGLELEQKLEDIHQIVNLIRKVFLIPQKDISAPRENVSMKTVFREIEIT
ncbi:MAG: hypothetical protein Q8N16_02640 [bacterium]|nr:hypothetical protein [bacterium]